MKSRKIFLGIIIFIAFILRLYGLGQNPPSLTWDEVAWGYNAYALGSDGKDEFGRFLPYDYLESFGDFKPPMYAYLDVLPVKAFGLNEFATRFPSAFFGVLTVFMTYFLTKRLFEKSPNKKNYALAATGILALSPWHIMLSRAAFEANVATFFIVSGVFFFLCGVQEKKWFLLLSTASFVLSMYTFNTARIVSPLLGIGLVVGFHKTLLRQKKELIIAGVIGVVLLLPVAKFLLSPQVSLRFREVNIFSDLDVIKTANQEIINDGNAAWAKIIHNRRLLFSTEYLKHYFDNLESKFLFIKGDGNPKFSTQDVGEMYLWDLPFFIVGVIFLFRKREENWWIIPYWLLIGIIPAATARETPHALRIEASLPTFQILVGYGVITITMILFPSLKNKQIQIATTGGGICLLILSAFYFQYGYYTHYAREYSGGWQYGYKDAIAYIETVRNNYNNIYFTTELGRPYVYVLFYSKLSPDTFRQTMHVSREVFGFVRVNKVGKYIFLSDVRNLKNIGKKNLYVDIPKRVPQSAKILKTFNLLNGTPSLEAYTYE